MPRPRPGRLQAPTTGLGFHLRYRQLNPPLQGQLDSLVGTWGMETDVPACLQKDKNLTGSKSASYCSDCTLKLCCC